MDTAAVTAATQSTVHVVATTVDGTRAALRVAVPLAKGWGAKLVVLVPRIVPYAIDLETPCPSTAFLAKRYENLVLQLGGAATIDVCLCRCIDDLAMKVASATSTVVVGGPLGRWMTSPEERFANRLSRHGRPVVFAASGCNMTQRRVAPSIAAIILVLVTVGGATRAEAQPALPQEPPPAWQFGASIDVGALFDGNAPANHLFRNRGTTPRVDELDVNMAMAYLRKTPSEESRLGVELTAQAGEDTKLFGFSATAPNIGGADVLLHLGPTNVSYLAPVGNGLTIQGGIFSSLIGYDSLYAKDNFAYTRPWGADYTPYLMLGANAAYPVTPKLTATAMVVNGYWHLANANDVPSVGGQLAYKATDTVTVKQTALYGPHQEETSLQFWRLLSDTIVERKSGALTTAFEYQLGTERAAEMGTSRAWWMSAQLPIHWVVSGPFTATVRPEIAWDSDGRWTGFAQTVKALTATLEYRIPHGGAQTIVRGEYRVDDSRGTGGGFFAGADNHRTPTQNLFVVAAIVTFDGSIRR